MTDFLLELRSEEIPARMQAGAREELASRLGDRLGNYSLHGLHIQAFSTPRRLTVIVRDLPESTPSGVTEIKGPRTSAPQQALDGFLRSTGLALDQLEDRNGVWFATVAKPGRPVAEVLAEEIPSLIRSFKWPKSMRWGKASASSESLRWVRPLSGIVAIFGEELIPCEVSGISAGFATRGHRFHCPGEITIGSASDYAEKLRACHVIVDHEERQAIIRDGAARAAADAGLTLVEDEGLVIENAGLTEWPVPLLGRFDEAFLEVPPEVIQLTARVNQKYFVVNDASGKLANGFVCTANIDAVDGGAEIVAGNRKVLAARLSDARFFWEQDRKTKLEDHAKKLDRITFHEKLGTVADKVERVAKLARWLVEEGIVKSSPERGGGAREARDGGGSRPDTALDAAKPLHHASGAVPLPASGEELVALADQSELAARLCKADLVTEMVGEFPELQGLMGGYYARAEGLPDAVADAIRDHYKPVGQGDDVPTAPVTVAVALADKLDTLAAFFMIDQKPTGSKDPFALRRAALAIVNLIIANDLRFDLGFALDSALQGLFAEAEETAETFFGKVALLGTAQAIEDGRIGRKTGVEALNAMPEKYGERMNEIASGMFLTEVAAAEFVRERLKVQQRENGVRHDLLDAVFAVRDEDNICVDIARVKALQAFMASDDGANLLAGYKRAANILKQSSPERGGGAREARDGGGSRPDTSHEAAPPLHHPSGGPPPRTGEDLALLAALDAAEPAAAAAVEEERFTDAMAALASLRAPIDAFFDGVMVNDPDEAVRAFRLGLLARFRDAVHSVADFSKIEG